TARQLYRKRTTGTFGNSSTENYGNRLSFRVRGFYYLKRSTTRSTAVGRSSTVPFGGYLVGRGFRGHCQTYRHINELRETGELNCKSVYPSSIPGEASNYSSHLEYSPRDDRG